MSTARTHTHAHTDTRERVSYTRLHTHTHAHTPAERNPRSYTRTHTYIHAPLEKVSATRTRTYTHAPAREGMSTVPHTHTCTLTQTRTHTRTHYHAVVTHTHACAHTVGKNTGSHRVEKERVPSKNTHTRGQCSTAKASPGCFPSVASFSTSRENLKVHSFCFPGSRSDARCSSRSDRTTSAWSAICSTSFTT